jgi:hypothetical protein
MKTSILIFFFSFSVLIGFAQEKTKQQIKEEKKIAKQKEIEVLVDSKVFEFQAITAYPLGGRNIDMISNPNFLRFENDSIDSQMPYFGTAFSGAVHNSGGLDFKGPIHDYSIKKGKKEYTIRAKVKGKADSYDILLKIFFEGNASLSISSNNRSSISYRGSIGELKSK